MEPLGYLQNSQCFPTSTISLSLSSFWNLLASHTQSCLSKFYPSFKAYLKYDILWESSENTLSLCYHFPVILLVYFSWHSLIAAMSCVYYIPPLRPPARLLAHLSDSSPPPGPATEGLLKPLVMNRYTVFRGTHGFPCILCILMGYPFETQSLNCQGCWRAV